MTAAVNFRPGRILEQVEVEVEDQTQIAEIAVGLIGHVFGRMPVNVTVEESCRMRIG